MKRRAVITGRGIVSSIGNNCGEVLDSLQNTRSGLEAVPEWAELGLMSHVGGTIKGIDEKSLRREIGRDSRYMDLSALYSFLASREALAESGLEKEALSDERVGCIVGAGFASSDQIVTAGIKLKYKEGIIGPYGVTRSMASSCSANLTNYYKIKGRSYNMTSACATGLHNIGHAAELIEWGHCDLVVAGGADEVSPIYTSLFDGMRGTISTSFNDDPTRASRAYDLKRDGFVVSGGAGIVMVEEYERAKKRGAPIFGEILGYGATSDGHDIVQPDRQGGGAFRAMTQAQQMAGCAVSDIDYVNAHATSTPAGDLAEAVALNRLFGDHKPRLSSTKSLTGHGIGASGSQELIYSLLMMEHGFVAASVNVDELDPSLPDLDIVTENIPCTLRKLLTNSLGFGGTNASMLLGQVVD